MQAAATLGALPGPVRQALRVPAPPGSALPEAVRQWCTRLVDAPPIRHRLLASCLRNPLWTEWPVWCAAVCRRMGYATTLVYSTTVLRRIYGARAVHHRFLGPVQAIPDIELFDLDTAPTSPEQADRFRAAAEDWAPVALAYDLHIEEENILHERKRHRRALDAYVQTTTQRGAALAGLLDRRGNEFSRFLLYSGLIGESPLLLRAALAAQLTTVCVENWAWRPGHMIYNVNAPALDYNIQGWMAHLGPWDAAREKEIQAYLKFQDGDDFGNQTWLNNFYNVQKARLSSELPPRLQHFLAGDSPIFLLTPNVVGDSSTLRRETIFTGMRSWLRETIAWFRDRPNLKLIIRAHPAERWIGMKCGVFMAQVAHEFSRGLPNVFIIDSAEKTNTFSLLPFARAGLVWLSSVGVDMVVRGVPTLCAASPKYAGLGIVTEPPSQAAYFAQLEQWVQHQERPRPEQILAGKRYMHLVFKGFSFEATDPQFNPECSRLPDGNLPADANRFYRILAGLDAPPDRPA